MYTMSREIGIDAGHRVPTHGSKCKNLHGHRYTIQAICKAGFLQSEGEQKAMVIDFGFLKEEMLSAQLRETMRAATLGRIACTSSALLPFEFANRTRKRDQARTLGRAARGVSRSRL